MMERLLFPRQEPVAEVHDRHARKVQRGNQRFDVMVSVDEIGGEADLVQTADDGNGRGAQFFGNRTQGQAERDRAMASADEGAADIADPELRAGPLAQRVVSEEDREGSHQIRRFRPGAWWDRVTVCSFRRVRDPHPAAAAIATATGRTWSR